MVGGIVGEKLGEKGATKFGIDEAAGQMSKDLGIIHILRKQKLGPF